MGDTVLQQQRVVGVQQSAEHDILIDAHSESMSTARDSQRPLGQPSASDPTTRGSTVDLKESREPIPTTSATLRLEDRAVDSDSLSCTSQGRVNPKDCNCVAFELRDNIPGVTYIKKKGTEPAWTPVVKRKRYRRSRAKPVATVIRFYFKFS